MVAATPSRAPRTNPTPSAVVTCSRTTLRAGNRSTSGASDALDELALAVEDVDIGVRDLAVHHQGEPALLHRVERRGAAFEVRHPVRGIRRRPGGIELDPEHPAAGRGATDLLRAGLVGEVEGHERLERCTGRDRGENPVAVRERRRGRRHRRREVRHHHRPRESPHGRGHHVREHRTVAKVRMPVVRSHQRDFVHGPGSRSRPLGASNRRSGRPGRSYQRLIRTHHARRAGT